MEVTSNCCFTSLFSSNKSEVTLSEVSNLDSARSALIFAFVRDLFAQLREAFRLLSSINRFLFCCSNSAMAKSVSQSDAVNWVSDWKFEDSGSVCIAIDTVLFVQNIDFVSDEEVLQEEVNGSCEWQWEENNGFGSFGKAVTAPNGALLRAFRWWL